MIDFNLQQEERMRYLCRLTKRSNINMINAKHETNENQWTKQ